MRFKRLIATALAAAMILGLVSVGFAASFEDTEGFEFEASVLKLADLGIISGYPDGTFKPDNLVTRAEFAKMIVCMLGLDAAAKSLEGEAVPFADVDADHWAAGYINVAQMMGIVNGYEDGTFRPEGNITYAEALKMVLAAMGYSEDGFLVVRWPATWIAKAIELELDKDLTIVSAGLPITRGEVAKLFDNSLTKKHVVVKDGEFVERRDPAVTFMSKLKVNYIEGQVIDSPELWSNTSGKVKIKGKDDEKSFAIEDYDGLLGHNVRVWYKGSKALGVEVLSTEKVLTANEYKKIDEPDLIFINFIAGEYDEEGNLQYKGEDFSVAKADEIVVVYDGSTPIAVKALQYTVDVIADIYSYGKRMDVYLKNGTLKLYDFDVEYVGVDGFDDLKEGDILHYIYDDENDKALIIVARDVVKGTLTEITYDNKIKVDGKAFSAVDETIVNELKEKEGVGKVVTLYLDKDGKVFDYKLASTPDAVYGVVQAIASRVVDKKPRTFHKVLTLEGEVEYIFAGTGTGPDVGAVVEITLTDDGATYTDLEEEDKIIEGEVKQRNTDEKTITIKDGTGKEYTYKYTENTLWVEGKKGEYVERPLPYIDDQVTLYYLVQEEGEKNGESEQRKIVVVGIVSEPEVDKGEDEQDGDQDEQVTWETQGVYIATAKLGDKTYIVIQLDETSPELCRYVGDDEALPELTEGEEVKITWVEIDGEDYILKIEKVEEESPPVPEEPAS